MSGRLPDCRIDSLLKIPNEAIKRLFYNYYNYIKETYKKINLRWYPAGIP